MTLGIIIFIAVLMALFVFFFAKNIAEFLVALFGEMEEVFNVIFLLTLFSVLLSFVKKVYLEFGWMGIYLLTGTTLVSVCLIFAYRDYKNRLETRIHEHNKKITNTENLELVKKYRKEFEKEIKLADKLTHFFIGNNSSTSVFNDGILIYLAKDLDLPESQKVFQKNDFDLYVEAESVLIDDDYETESNDPIFVYRFKVQNNIGFEDDYILLCIIHPNDLYSFFVLNAQETLLSLKVNKYDYNLKKFKPGNWTSFLIGKIDAFFNEIKVFEEKKRENARIEDEERKSVEKQEQEQKIKQDFL